MRIGIVTPVVVQHPATRSDWESGAGAAEIATIARAADRLGYEHLTCSEHIAIPAGLAAERGATYWDPLATLAYLGALTDRIRLVTQVLVLGYHHPLEIAKRYGTLDLLSSGRVTLGVGVGSLREEFDLLGAPFEGRGPRADDAIRALRAALSRSRPEYRGAFYEFDDMVVEPHAVQHRVPLWVGGRTRRSLTRALALADGWVPFGLSLRELREMVHQAEPPDGFEVVLGVSRPLDPIAAPAEAARALDRLSDAGATVVNVTLAATSAEHYCEQLHALREITLRP